MTSLADISLIPAAQKLSQYELVQYKRRGKDYHTASSARVVIYLNQTELQHWLDELRVEHRDLDVVIKHLQDSHHHDNMRVQRLKRRKLKLKDMITRLESGLIPDLDA